jgi:hypothetical protein
MLIATFLVSSSALADEASERVKRVCVANALTTYSKAVSELRARDGLKLPSIAAVMERRHLAEAYCLQRAGCLEADKPSQDALGLEFEICLRDDETQHLKANRQAR